MCWQCLAQIPGAHLLSVCRMTAIKIGDGIEEESSSDDYDQVMFTQM